MAKTGTKRQGFNTYKILNENTAEFYIINKKDEHFTVIVDKDDLDRLIKLNRQWHVVWFEGHQLYYPRCCEYLSMIDGKPKYKIYYLQRWLLNITDKDVVIDHINHNTLDNRKSNLRITSIFKNTKHREGKNKNNTSGYRNVSWRDSINKWVVQLQIDGKNTTLGEFDDVDEAGKFAEIKRNELYGEFAGN